MTEQNHDGRNHGFPGADVPAADVTSVFQAVSTGELEAPGEQTLTGLEALRPGTALLVVKRGPNAGSRFQLDKDLVSAGRHPDSDIFLDDVTVSRRHAEFRQVDGGFQVSDVGSLNGTYVNREPIETSGLSNGDEVQIGKFRLVFLTADQGAADQGATDQGTDDQSGGHRRHQRYIGVMSAGLPAGSSLSIGAVLARLKPEFSDVTISKIRFLETEGLIEPQRTPAGYRQFTPTDVERLRYVLAAQRDHYLPLRVIKEQLDAIDRGLEPATPAPRLPRSLVSTDGPRPEDFAPAAEVRMSRVELLADSGLTTEQLRELEGFSLLGPGPGGWYDADSALVAKSAAELLAAGLDPRHLRPMRTAAERESTLISQMVSSQARQSDPDARERAEATAGTLAAQMLQLHSLLVKVGLRRDLRH